MILSICAVLLFVAGIVTFATGDQNTIGFLWTSAGFLFLTISISFRRKEDAQKEEKKEDYKALKQEVQKSGVTIPPMVSAYMGLSATMRIFGTAVNYGFGNVEETGLLIAVDEILEEKRIRYIESFIKSKSAAVE